MASSFPTSLDAFTNPTSADALDSVSVPHATQHSDLNDAVEALEAKVGVDSSAVTSSLDYKVAQLEAISHGKILQVVRATDTTARTTTSTSFVDANISVTITPTSATSDILLIWSFYASAYGPTNSRSTFQITDSSNVGISGAESTNVGINSSAPIYDYVTMVGYGSPATTSATTYKGRFLAVSGATAEIRNSTSTGQMFALEISA